MSFATPVLMNLFSVSMQSRLNPGSTPSCFAHASTSSLRYPLDGFPSLESSSASGSNSSPLDTHRGTLARPSEMRTTTTLPTSPDFCALRPVRDAAWRASANGEPPPHGMISRLFFARAMDLVGGRRTSARSPWKGIRQIWSRLWYASVRRLMAAPFAAFMRLSAMEPDASTTKMMSDPAFRAIFFVRTSLCSMNTPRPSFFVPTARFRRPRWYGADARSVASTARRTTLPLGSMGLMYLPLSWEKMRPRPPPFPERSRDVKSMRSGSMGMPSTSNMNS
mmetsp:Transcript_36323/g.77462  ORF Transcript_36323/g.77462 Transcript_36323/m.77462 type:complete len:279 (+) Transcript_36323:212-1048(+)